MQYKPGLLVCMLCLCVIMVERFIPAHPAATQDDLDRIRETANARTSQQLRNKTRPTEKEQFEWPFILRGGIAVAPQWWYFYILLWDGYWIRIFSINIISTEMPL